MNSKSYYDKRNKRRRLVINLIKEITGDSKLGNSLRDKGNKYLLGRFNELTVVNGVLQLKKHKTSKKRVKKEIIEEPRLEDYKDDEKSVEDNFIKVGKPIKESRSDKRKRLYKEAREQGYTVEEAKKLRDKGQSSFNNIIKYNRVVNNQSRYDKWSLWGKDVAKIQRKITQAEKDNKSASYIFDLEEKKASVYPKWITDQVREINEELGYDYNSSYGWNVMYYYYTEGGTIEFWKTFFVADPLNPNIYRARTTVVVNVENRQRRLK